MIDSGTCPKCGSKQIAGPHRIMGQHHVRVDLPGLLTATLESLTCGICGYTEHSTSHLILSRKVKT